MIIQQYFDGAQVIDVHNHLRQSGLNLETALNTQRWDIRFFCTLVGIVEVDSYRAYCSFCPGKGNVTHRDFILNLAKDLIDNTIGKPHGGMVLRPRPSDEGDRRTSSNHVLVSLSEAKAYKFRKSKKSQEPDFVSPSKTRKLNCSICKKKCHYFCKPCSTNKDGSKKKLVRICGPKSGRDCFRMHLDSENDE
jgi:hypothetical protein